MIPLSLALCCALATGGKIFHHGMDDPQSWHEYFPRPPDPEPKRKPHVGLGHRDQFWRWQPLEDADDDDMADGKLAVWAEKFLAREHSKPFFLGVGFWRPHMPWHVPQKYFDRFPLESIQLPKVLEGDVDDLPGYGRWLAHERTGFHAELLQREQWEVAVQAYLACIAFTDAMLGRVLDALDASPYAANTIIVLWSDHGMHLGEKQHWTKWGLWEQAIRTARWRYIRYRDGGEELYDHETDPREWTNLAGDPRYAEAKVELQQWLPEVNVPDSPYLERSQYWPGDPSPNDVSDYPRPKRAEAAPALP